MKKIISVLGVSLAFMEMGCAGSTAGFGLPARKVKASSNVITKEVVVKGKINSVSATSMFDVEYVQGPQRVEIYASDNVVPYIKVTLVNGELTVGSDKKRNVNIDFDKKPCVVKVSSPSATTFTTNGSGDITLVGDVKGSGDITLNSYGSGDLKAGGLISQGVVVMTGGSGDVDVMDVDSRTLMVSTKGSGDVEVKSVKSASVSLTSLGSGDIDVIITSSQDVKCVTNGSGDIDLKGRCGNLSLTSNGSGDIGAAKLVADHVKATSNGSGDIECNAVVSLEGAAHGSGDIEYAGKPGNLNINSKTKVHPR